MPSIGPKTREEFVSIVLGEHNVMSRTETNLTKTYRVEDLTIHPGFNRSTFENDIALIELKQPVNFDSVKGIVPICLPHESLRTEASEGEIYGWQSFPWAPEMKDEPEKVFVNIMSRSECNESLTSFNVVPSMICVKNFDVGTCKSDVGGALIVIEKGRYFLYGIGQLSDCRNGGAPAIYTDIRAHLHWILSKNKRSCKLSFEIFYR
ncbi:Plasma kallikrein [Armadillidium vulgare]|nr:Plasma kallikrein [Armadillidium vulgare]